MRRFHYWVSDAREWLLFDCHTARATIALAVALVGLILFRLGARGRGLRLLTAAHRSAGSRGADRIVESLLCRHGRIRAALAAAYRDHFKTAAPNRHTERFYQNPARFLRTRMLVLKAPAENEHGILVLDYSFTFRAFGALFDVRRIATRYYLVLEPSWAGYCDPDILSFTQFECPVFVESAEPRDTRLIDRLSSNLIPVPIAANWWTDHRVMRPLPLAKKEFDFVYNAAFASYKRHARLFEALGRLRRRGERFTLLLVGYAATFTKDEMFQQVRDFGLAPCVEIREQLSPEEVNCALNAAKVNILWSRREGFNRALIEGFLADVPCVMREGFNFGYRYPYINPETGCFASETELLSKLLWMRDNYQAFQPRAWVLARMSCQQAAEILGRSVHEVADRAGEHWTHDPVVKVSFLNTMAYWDPKDNERFASDYAFLTDAILTRSSSE